MTAIIDTKNVTKGFIAAAKDPQIQALALAAFRHALDSGLKENHSKGQGTWKEHSEEYQEEKRRRGFSTEKWVMTGKTLRAISGNAPTKFGTKKGLKFGINKRNLIAFAQPRAFVNPRTKKKLKSKDQEKVLTVLTRGSKAMRTGGGGKRIAARPLVVWNDSWRKVMTRDVERAAARILKEGGFNARG